MPFKKRTILFVDDLMYQIQKKKGDTWKMNNQFLK